MAQPISEGYFLPWSPFLSQQKASHGFPRPPPFSCLAGFSCGTLMLQIANNLIVGFHSDTERVSGRSVETAHNNDRARPF
jgi:hypothetical protein